MTCTPIPNPRLEQATLKATFEGAGTFAFLLYPHAKNSRRREIRVAPYI